uniref:glutamate receptor 2.1-like n=1 Tax=Erigeron canadensis TaxID=72917 RepID=UPI001CB96181|nr:glutamate receptor 2.1-like [Erigeron canadensis]
MGNHHVIVLLFTMMMMMMASNGVENELREVGIGVILDMDSNVGRSTRICILMALEDFYGARHNNFTTIIHPHFRDSKFDNFRAASAAIDLRKNTQVIAFFGPQQSSQAHFVLDIANTFKLPVISPATTQNSSTQAEPIAALIKSFGWTEVVFVFEDTDFGRGPIPYLFDAMGNIGTRVKYCTLLSPSSSDNTLMEQVYKLKTTKTRVFVVHMLPALASRFFRKAYELGMMAPGYAWIITDVLTGFLSHLDPQDLDYMQGVLGVKPYIPPSNHLTSFERKWRTRFHKEYPNMPRIELDMFGIWSYDSISALAAALQRIENEPSTNTKIHDLAAIEISQLGSKLLPLIQNTRIKGLSGDFHVVNGQLQTSAYQIVNVIGNGEKHIGFWNPMTGLSKQTRNNQKLDYTTSKDILKAIIWPGDTPKIPEGWDNKKLRVGVPALRGFVEFMEA